jgi:hypothetical protein
LNIVLSNISLLAGYLNSVEDRTAILKFPHLIQISSALNSEELHLTATFNESAGFLLTTNNQLSRTYLHLELHRTGTVRAPYSHRSEEIVPFQTVIGLRDIDNNVKNAFIQHSFSQVYPYLWLSPRS